MVTYLVFVASQRFVFMKKGRMSKASTYLSIINDDVFMRYATNDLKTDLFQAKSWTISDVKQLIQNLLLSFFEAG